MKITKATEMDNFLKTDEMSLNYSLREASIRQVKAKIAKAAEIADLDEDRLVRRINSAAGSKNEYGKVPGLINLLANIVNWPTDESSADGINETREEILAELGIDHTLLEDLREAKGYHSFISDEHELMKGVEPAYDEYRMLVMLIARKLGIEVVDIKLDEDDWNKAEAKAIIAANKELEDVKVELEKHKQLHSA